MAPSMVVMVAVAVMMAVVTVVIVIVTMAMAPSRPSRIDGSHPKHDKSDAGKFYFCHESLHSSIRITVDKNPSENELVLLIDITHQ